MSTQPAVSKLGQHLVGRRTGPGRPRTASTSRTSPTTRTITIVGDASFENDAQQDGVQHQAGVAPRHGGAGVDRRRSSRQELPVRDPTGARRPAGTDRRRAERLGDARRLDVATPRRTTATHWQATVTFTPNTPAQNGSVTVHRDAAPTPTPTSRRPKDPPLPEVSPPPTWFRSAKVMVRIVDSQLIALQLDLEVDINTMTEQKLQGQMGGAPPARSCRAAARSTTARRSGPNNPADGIMAMRVLVQTDPSTGRWTTLLTVGADPADTDGLVHFGWIPQVDPMPPSKDLGVTFLGSYLSFWPMLAAVPPVDAVRNAVEGREGGDRRRLAVGGRARHARRSSRRCRGSPSSG